MDSFIIPLNGWAAGERKFRFHADTEFFQKFDNTEILDADVNVEIRVTKEGMQKVEAVLHLQSSSGRGMQSRHRPVSESQGAWGRGGCFEQPVRRSERTF